MNQTRAQRLAIAEEFLTELGRGIPGDQRVMIGNADEATTERDSSGKVIKGGWWPKPWKPDKYTDANCNFYACISSSIKTQHPTRKGEMRYWRGESSFGHGLALIVDDIALSAEARGAGSKGALTVADLAAVLPPTAVVETSPGNTQCLYFMDAPVSDMRRFKAFLVCFVQAVLKGGGDSTVKDVSRFFRAPIGFNNKRHEDGSLKYPDATGKPWEVRLVEADYSRRYSMEDVAEAFGFVIVEPALREVEPMAATDRAHEELWLKIAVRILDRAKMGEGSGGAVVLNASGKYRIQCPWGDEHANGDPYGAYFWGSISGVDHEYVFGCGHQTCRDAGRTWHVFIDEIVISYLADCLETANVMS